MITELQKLDIQSGISAVLKSKKKTQPQHVNRISALDDSCLRRLYYMRHDWDKAKEVDDGLQGVFESGNILEPIIERIVSEVGMSSTPRWRIVGTQTTTNDRLLKEYQISGTIDGFLQVENDSSWVTMGVVDIKTMSPNVYPMINDYDSLGRYSWTRRYRGQLMLYALAHNIEQCFILAVNKSNLFEMKLIEFTVDMAYCDRLLDKAKMINDAIATDTAPDGINDPDVCPECRWYSFCCPDITTGGNLQISDNAELEAILDRMSELKPVEKEYTDLEAQRDAILIKGQDLACGKWLVTWKRITITHKAKEAYSADQWRKSIVCK